jgi:hypothetical protein
MQNPLEQLSRMKRNHSRATIVLAAVVPFAFTAMPAPAGAQEKMTTPSPASKRNPISSLSWVMISAGCSRASITVA